MRGVTSLVSSRLRPRVLVSSKRHSMMSRCRAIGPSDNGEYGLNVSAISDAALEDAVRAARARAWSRENAEAIAERKAWIEANGTPLADIQVLKTR